MDNVNATAVPSRGARIATLERALAQILSQLTALQTRVGILEAHQAQRKTPLD